MKKKEFLIIGLSILLLLSIILNIFFIRKTATARKTADELDKALNYVSIIVTAEEKQKFSEEMDKKYEVALDKQKIVSPSNEDIEALIANKILSELSDEEAIFLSLEKYGIYHLLEADINTKRTKDYLNLSTPHIFYNATNQTWIVAAWGNWNSDEWNHSLLSGDMEERCQFGVYHSEIEGNYDTHVTNSIGYIADSTNIKSTYTTNRSGFLIDESIDGQGFYFELQDYTYGIFSKKYVGEKWYGSCTYSASYKEFGSEITAYYKRAGD